MNTMIFHKDQETSEERANRETHFWRGFRDRRSVIKYWQVQPHIDPEAIKSGNGFHWWNGYQAGAQ